MIYITIQLIPKQRRNNRIIHLFLGGVLRCHYILKGGPGRKSLETTALTNAERDKRYIFSKIITWAIICKSNSSLLRGWEQMMFFLKRLHKHSNETHGNSALLNSSVHGAEEGDEYHLFMVFYPTFH